MFPIQASSSCSFSRPVTFDGIMPSNRNEPWQFASSTCTFSYPEVFFTARGTTSSTSQNVIITGYAVPATTSTSTQFGIYPYLTIGEIILIFFAFLFLFYIITKSIIVSIWQITTGRKYLQYGGGDVEIRHDN